MINCVRPPCLKLRRISRLPPTHTQYQRQHGIDRVVFDSTFSIFISPDAWSSQRVCGGSKVLLQQLRDQNLPWPKVREIFKDTYLSINGRKMPFTKYFHAICRHHHRLRSLHYQQSKKLSSPPNSHAGLPASAPTPVRVYYSVTVTLAITLSCCV